jgi:hypothetical protein
MPCDTIQTTTVNLGKVNGDLLAKAMQSIGCPYFTYDGERVRVAGKDVTQNEIKVAYSRQVVMSQAQRFGWQFKQTGPNKFEVIKAGKI